jgi:dihydroneopterin aldolase
MQDKVFIEDLEVETIIGIFGWERKVKQIVKISLEMDFNISDAAKTDNIDQALDYKSIGKDISSFVGKSSFQLVETMADKIAKRVLKNKSIEKVEVKVEKQSQSA